MILGWRQRLTAGLMFICLCTIGSEFFYILGNYVSFYVCLKPHRRGELSCARLVKRRCFKPFCSFGVDDSDNAWDCLKIMRLKKKKKKIIASFFIGNCSKFASK